MNALDPGDDEGTRGAAEQGTSREVELGETLQASLVEHPGAVRGAGASLEELADFRVGLEALELLREDFGGGRKKGSLRREGGRE